MQLTAVIPVFNESASLKALYDELTAVAVDQDYELGIVFVDDGSTDDSWSRLRRLAMEDDRVLGIRFRRNFGKAAALSAGFAAAETAVVVTLDADRQDDPSELPRMLQKLNEGYDVVSGWKQVRYDPWHKVLPSRAFNWLVSKITGVELHDHNCGFKCYRQDVLQEVRLYGELHRFVPVLAAARGFRIAEVPVNHRPREHGHSKYGARRIVKGLLDLITVKFITGYGQRPQHVLGSVGLASFVLGGGGMFLLACRWIISRMPGWEPLHLHETAMLYYCLGFMLLGAQFLSVGLLGEMVAAFLSRDVDTYSIAEHTSTSTQEEPAGNEPTTSVTAQGDYSV